MNTLKNTSRSILMATALFVPLAIAGTGSADCKPWTFIGEGGPEGRAGHAMVYDSARNVLVLYGGITQDAFAPALADTWEWDGNEWTLVADKDEGPGENRRDFAIAYDSARGVTILFGGRIGPMGSDPTLGDTWEWDGQSWTLVAETGPAPRHSHALAYDSERQVTVLFGGNTNDTWEWDGNEWKQVASGGPAARTDLALAYDANRGVTVLNAGVTAGPFGGVMLNDTWEWDGDQWKLMHGGPGLEAVKWHAVAYDSHSKGVRRFSGFGASQYDPQATVQWNGQEWTTVQTFGPPSRWLHAMAYHEELQATILFGGRLEAGLLHVNDMWMLPACPPSIPGDLTGSGTVGVADLLILLGEWGRCADCADCIADLTGDCNVGVPDLLVLLGNWG